MRVKVLFFGATAETAKTRSATVELSSGATSGDAFRVVIEQYPALSSHKLLYSVNQVYAKGDEVINRNDELAIFTAVSGG